MTLKMETRKVMDDIRINPPVVEFQDVSPEIVYQIPVSIQNLSKNLKRFRLHAPSSENFQVTCKNTNQVIAPGLEMNALVEYHNDKEEDCKSQIILLVDEEVVEIPLTALAPKSAMEITGPVDFGTIIADGKVIRKEIAILNRGSKNGSFKINYAGNEPIIMIPTQGVVKAGYSQPVRFEFISKNPGILKEVVSVTLEGHPTSEVRVLGNVAKRSLQLLSMEDEQKVDCIAFGPAYYGTDVLKSFVLYNHSPDEVSFVVILEEGGEGQEVGVDLSLTKSMALSDMSLTQSNANINDLTSLVTACPSQGTLRPYDKRLLHFKFSPRASKSSQGWSATERPQPRRDFALFVHIDIVGDIEARHGKNSNVGFGDGRVEVALTGTALPVFMSILPSPAIQFDNCAVGSHLDCCVTVRNDSLELPLSFIVPKSAHFVPLPQSHKLSPNTDLDLLISFRPNQIGKFRPKMEIIVVGYTCDIAGDFSSLPKFKQSAISKFPLQIEGVSLPVIGQKTAKSLSAQGRLYPQPSSDHNFDIVKTADGASLRVFSSDDANPTKSALMPVASKRACKTGKNSAVSIAQPDDRATSIRPSNKKEKILTKFTKTERYSYVDPDYGYTHEQDEEKKSHRQKYVDYIQKLRTQKIEKEKDIDFKKLDNEVDIGIKAGRGLRPTKLKLKEVFEEPVDNGKLSNSIKPEDQLLSSKKIEKRKMDTSKKKVSEGLKAIASTATEKADCAKSLTPQELYQVFIGPKVVDFGEVCAKSVASKKLKIANNLKTFIHIKVEIECRELRQSSPLSQIVPPGCIAALDLHFESNTLGNFERSVSYTVNGHHASHVIVLAEVVTVGLTLSTHETLLSPSAGLPPEAGMRKTITLYNKRNMVAEFSWLPVVGKDGTAFSVRPARGTVNPSSNLECEVVFYPSYFAPLSGLFQLRIEGGNHSELQTLAEIGPTSCSFVEHRLMFGAVPLNLDTRRSAFLKNTSQNHAFFKIVEPSPIPGMSVTPKTGIVPVGGTAELVVTYKPLSVQKFDTQIDVAIRGWKTISLRMGGHVEPPCVDVDVDSFQFGGVYCGAKAVIPFQLNNLARSRAIMAFDLSQHQDFTLRFGSVDDVSHEMPNAEGCYEVGLVGQEEMCCYLEFNPIEVASYDLIIPAIINQTAAPTPPPSPYPASVVLSKSGYPSANSEPSDFKKASQYPTPSRRVQATALRPPLQVSNTNIDFLLPSGYYDLGIESAAGRAAGVMFVNNSNKKLRWSLDIEKGGQFIKNGAFQFLHRSGSPYAMSSHNNVELAPSKMLDSGETSQIGVLFTPPGPGLYQADIPIILNEDLEQPYRTLHLHGELEAASLTFEPAAVHFSPVPLRTKTSMEINIVAKGYRKAVGLGFQIPQVELEDGSEVTVLEISFPNGKIIQPCCEDAGDKEPFLLPCQISFCAPKRVSFVTSVTFVTQQESYKLPVIATADNSLLTCYNFLALHQSDYHVVCEELTKKTENPQPVADHKERVSYGEALFIPCVSAIRSPTENSQITTSTSFGLCSSTYPESTVSSARSGSDANEKEEDPDETTSPFELSGTDDTSSDSEEEKYIKEICRTVQRWFSSQAWSSGPYPVSLPFSLRSCFETGINDGGTTRAGTWSREKKDSNKTVFDIVTHLCGKAVPGIPINASLPTDAIERTKHVYWMYSTLLTFLRYQGAMVASIKPEHLLGKNDFERWVLIRDSEMENSGEKFPAGSSQREQDKYETFSRHAWVDLLLQIVKVLVLSRITPLQYRKVILPDRSSPLPTLNADPLCSNVYSVGERILLAWINHHFEQQRNAEMWRSGINGTYPSSRWIVNFDNDFLDGLVLASLLAAHTPFLVPKFLTSMYTQPNTAEQCLHNALKVVVAVRYLGFDYDIIATDITEPNPVGILLLCIYLYHRLPHYIPRASIEFTGPLHADITKHVKLQNPSSKPLVYQIIIAGDHASDFSVTSGKTVKVPPKSQTQLPVVYRSSFLRPCSATLILVGKRIGSQVGSTLVFNLTTAVDTITPMGTIKTDSQCYELKKLKVEIKNPFNKSADFKIILIEAKHQSAVSPRTTKKAKKSKLKAVESKTDHGVKKKNSPRKEESSLGSQNATLKNFQDTTESNMTAFWCPSKEIHLDPLSSGSIQVEFLPFNTGHRQCSLLFLNEEVGEFVYSIEADALLPLPSVLPYQPSSHSVRVSSASTAERSRGMFGDNERVVYWQCEVKQEISEEILLPLVNQAKENALVIATKQRMSEKELKRREVTGSLSVSTISLALQTMGISENSLANSTLSLQSKASGNIGFVVEKSSQYFQLPKIFDIPTATTKTDAEETARLPVTFTPEGPGHYQCRIVLRAPNDVRVYQLECTVNPEGPEIELEFTSPTHECVTQNIPIVNNSDRDWNMTAKIEGEGFSGSDKIFCPRMTSASFPLTFRPMYEGTVKGHLMLVNTVSGTETIFQLSGLGKKPLQLDHIELNCQVRELTTYELKIPNVTSKKMVFQAFCDLDFICGPALVTVLPKQTATFTIALKPWRRGVFEGVISFVSDDQVTKNLGLDKAYDSDSDEDDVSLPNSSRSSLSQAPTQLPNLSSKISSFTKPYRVWYSMRVTSSPAPPAQSLEIECPAHERVTCEILVENPTDEKVEFEVIVEGSDLIAGDDWMMVQPGATGIYEVDFAPMSVGQQTGLVVFQHPAVGEIWYDLLLTATTPSPKELKIMQCPLGSTCHQMIRLDNPTDECVTYTVTCSNLHNFRFDLHDHKIELPPHSGIEVPLSFSPSALGLANHKAEISFSSQLLGDMMYYVTGSGQSPVPSADHVIRSSVTGSSSTIISFTNPFEEDILVDVELHERPFSKSGFLFNSSLDNNKCRDEAFSHLLRQPSNILLAPRSILDIPISFAPDRMVLHEAICYVTASKADGTSFESTFSYNKSMRWVFPIKGIPESTPIKDSKAPRIECRSRERLEEKLELSFTGINLNISKATHSAYLRALSPAHILGETNLTSELDLGMDYTLLTEDFKYEFDYPDTEAQIALERSVGLNLIRKVSHRVSGVVTLMFNVVFAPSRSFSHLVHLIITAGSGGVWRYPLKFTATEPSPDDVIEVEAAGLNREVTVGFRLTSQTNVCVPFWASLEASGDQMFTVAPTSGELPPSNSPGQLFKITYKPKYYGKTHTSKFIVQTADMQWVYELRGVLPDYQPPTNMLPSQEFEDGIQQAYPINQKVKNFVRDNLTLRSTAASSPLKGTPLVRRGKKTLQTDVL